MFSGFRGFLSVLKRPGREIDHSSACSAYIKNEWSLSSTPLDMGWQQIRIQDRSSTVDTLLCRAIKRFAALNLSKSVEVRFHFKDVGVT